MGFLDSVLGTGMGAMGGVCGFIPNCEFIMLGLKIVMLLFIIGWVRSHLGGGLVATIVMLFIGYLALFQYFAVFGPLTIVYLLIIMGVGGAITDLAFGREYYGLGGESGAASLQQRMMRHE
ncbi:hypothetical protein ACFLQ2_00960 [archaeon]